MRILSTDIKFWCLLPLLFLLIAPTIASGQTLPVMSSEDQASVYAEDIFMDMDMDQNLATPVVPDRLKPTIAKHVRKIAEKYGQSLHVELMRDGEVMVITFPTDDLFLPNDTLLTERSKLSLGKIEPLLTDPYEYKVVVALHTDNTGSESYREALSQARINSLYDWFLDRIDTGNVSEDIILIPFSMASSDPITDNLTRSERHTNRRVEFYFIPGPKMIMEADSGQL